MKKKDVHREIDDIEEKVTELKFALVDKTPPHFSAKVVARAFFGALLIGITFILKGEIIKTSSILSPAHFLAIFFVTVFILVLEIYYLGYRKVPNKEERKPVQFILKRLVAFYGIGLFVSALLVFLYGMNLQVDSMSAVFKVIMIVSLPCSFGAGMGDLIRRYF